MMSFNLPRPLVRPLPPVAATLALGCLVWWGTAPNATPDILSLAGAAALIWAVGQLLCTLDAPQPDRAAALVALLPGVAIGTAAWPPYEALWATPCVMALAAAVARKHPAMLAWCGVAIGIAPQALLIAPFFIALTIARRVPPRVCAIAPLATTAVALAVWATGWTSPTPSLFSSDVPLAANAPNLWQIVEALPLIGTLPLVGLALAAASGAIAAYIAWFSTRRLDGKALLAPALLAPMIGAGLLPHMHEGAFLLAAILALTLALARRDRRDWRIAALVVGGSIGGLFAAITGVATLAMLGAIAMIVATARIARPLLQPFANDNPLLARVTHTNDRSESKPMLS